MPKLPIWESDPLRYLVDAKFPVLVLPPSLSRGTPGSGPRGAELTKLLTARKEYEDELRLLSLEELNDEVRKHQNSLAEKSIATRREEEKKQIFHNPAANADFKHWMKCSYWTIDEAVALSLGKDPRYVKWEKLKGLVGYFTFPGIYATQRDVFMRAVIMKQLWDQTIPSVFIAWAQRMQITLPPDLIRAAEKLGVQVSDWKTMYDSVREMYKSLQSENVNIMQNHNDYVQRQIVYHEELSGKHKELYESQRRIIDKLSAENTKYRIDINELKDQLQRKKGDHLGSREKDSLLKIVIGMAVKGYGYNPNAGRNSTASEIAGDLRLIGLSIDEDTVRKYLNEGRDLLPGDIPE